MVSSVFNFFPSYGLECNSSSIILEYSELQNTILETLQTFGFGSSKQAFDILWLTLPHNSDALLIGLRDRQVLKELLKSMLFLYKRNLLWVKSSQIYGCFP